MRYRKDLIIKLENLEFESRLKCKSDNYRFVDEGEVVTYTNRAPLTLLRFQIREHAGYYEIDDFEIINKEDNKMNEFKKELETSLESLAKMVSRWEELTTHERATVEQIAQETSFDELGNFEEVVDKFKQFYQQMQKTTVIDGYQVYVDNIERLNIVVENAIWDLGTLIEIKQATKKGYPKEVPTETMLKIIEWYIEEV